MMILKRISYRFGATISNKRSQSTRLVTPKPEEEIVERSEGAKSFSLSALLLPSFLPPSDPVTENVLRCDTTEAVAAAPSSAREDEADGGRGGGQGREPEAIAIARRVRFSLGDSVGGPCWIGIRFHVRRPSPSPPLLEMNRDGSNLSSKKPPRSDDKIFHPLMSGKEVFHPPALTRTSKEGLWQQQRERQERD